MGTRAEPDKPLRGLRILVADDEIMIALDIEATLREAGASVVGPFTTLEGALKAAAEERLSAAILDIRLGQTTTGPVAEELSNRRIPVVFYSGQALPEEMHAHAPNAPLLSKPARQGAFVTAIIGLGART
jgi:CheY-like chemotaxis protein